MKLDPRTESRIESYLANLRRYLRELPPEEATDILLEIRSHIIDRAEAAGDLSDERVVQILQALGRPEEIGPLYESEAMINRARVSFSPFLILRTTLRWAMRSALGFAVFLVGLFGYTLSFGLLACAILKPIVPQNVGLWVRPNGLFNFGVIFGVSHEGMPELLGWWMIPVGIVGSTVFLVVTTHLLRIMLRYARKSPMLSAVPA